MDKKFLAEFEMYVMLAIARLGDDSYGASVRAEIEERTGRPVSIGALYATLHRLGAKDLLAFEAQEDRSGQRGRPRKYCRLTPSGRTALEHSAEMMRRMLDGVAIPAVRS